jgi:hypothetical protein
MLECWSQGIKNKACDRFPAKIDEQLLPSLESTGCTARKDRER